MKQVSFGLCTTRSRLELIDDWSGFGQRTTGSGTVKFNQVFVAKEDVIPFDTAFNNRPWLGLLPKSCMPRLKSALRAAFEETLQRVRQARPWIDANVEQPTKIL
jgi:alkylation response protein AidB-like acyl-CoA dehydrogenase